MTDPNDPEGDEFDSLRNSLSNKPAEENFSAGPSLISRLGSGLQSFFELTRTGISEITGKIQASRVKPEPEETPEPEFSDPEPEPETIPTPRVVAKPKPKLQTSPKPPKPKPAPVPEPDPAPFIDAPDDDFAPELALRSQSNEQAFDSVPESEPNLVERLTNSVSDMDPRLVVGVGITALGLVAIVGFLVLFSLARNRPSSSPGTQVVVVTGNPTPPQADASLTPTLTSIPSTETPGPSPTIDLTGTVTNLPLLRFATLSDFKGTVQVRSDPNAPWKTVNETLTIVPGTTVLTGENSTVKITLSQGAIVRLSSQTQFTLTEMSGTASRPETVLGLDFGKLWAIVEKLGEGTFEIQMPAGVAAVRGTYISVEHNTTDKIEIVTCLEGSCSYRNSNGRVTLNELQQSESVNGAIPSAPHPMDASQLADWNPRDIPEILALTPTLVPSLTRPPTKTKQPLPTKPPATAAPSGTPTASKTPTSTPTVTATGTLTPGTPTPTVTASRTPTATKTVTKTNTPITPGTPTFTPTPTNTTGPTSTSTDTPAPTATDTPAPTPTDTDTPAPTPTDTDTPVPTDTDTPVPTPTDTPGP